MGKIGRNKASNKLSHASGTVVGFKSSEQASDANLDRAAESRPTNHTAQRPTKTSGYDKLVGTKLRGGEHMAHKPIVRGTMHRRSAPESVQPGREMLGAAKQVKKP